MKTCIRLFPIVSLFYGFILSSCAAHNIHPSIHNEKHFRLAVPDGFEIKRTTLMEDFHVYTVSSSGNPYVGIYVGNQPDSPAEEMHSRNRITTFRSADLEVVSIWEDDRLVGRKALFKLNGSSGWPAYVQAWTYDLPADQIGDANKIFDSIAAQ